MNQRNQGDTREPPPALGVMLIAAAGHLALAAVLLIWWLT